MPTNERKKDALVLKSIIIKMNNTMEREYTQCKKKKKIAYIMKKSKCIKIIRAYDLDEKRMVLCCLLKTI